MPTEPPPCAWAFPPADAAGEAGLVAVGADLAPGTLLAAYRSGIFPMPVDGLAGPAWFSPDPRGVLPLDGFRASRSLRRSARRFTVTADRAFGAVVEGCADPRRPGGWITAEVRDAYVRLHELGLGPLDRGVGRGRRARRRALRRRARRAVRGGVDVPRRHGRVQGGAGRAGRAAGRGRRRARARRAVDDAAPADARRARRRRAGTSWRGCRRRSARRRRSRRRPARPRRAPRSGAGAASRARSRAAGSATCPRRAA